MKRALPGKKSKKATPARKLAAKHPTVRLKSKLTKPATKKRSAVKKPKTTAARTKKIAKPKVVRAKAPKPKRRLSAKRKTIKRVVAREKKIQTEAAPVPSVSAASVVPTKSRTRPGVARKTTPPALTMEVAEPTVPFAIESDEELAMPAIALPETPPAKRNRVPKAVRKNARTPVRKPAFTVPAFLLEGDEPSHPLSGSGEKFALGPTPPLDHFDEANAPLPDSYGTGRLFLTARDPHWLYAHWDFTMQEQFRYNAQSVDRHMVLRLHDADKPSTQISEIHVHPESRHWFTHVETAGKKYVAEIGYYQAGRTWKSLATSAPQRTPPDNISADATIEFATIPLELPFATMLALLKEDAVAAAENLPLARGLEQLRGVARSPVPQGAEWTPEQEAALARLLAASGAGPTSPSSGEFVAERSWPEFAFESESGDAGGLPAPSSYVSSFLGGADQQDFWFNLNAELVVYGATEPNATVTFAGKAIPLWADGSFRCHFALPDGNYELPVTAVSADGTDGRAAELKFTRATEIRGPVGVHPQTPALRPPPKTG